MNINSNSVGHHYCKYIIPFIRGQYTIKASYQRGIDDTIPTHGGNTEKGADNMAYSFNAIPTHGGNTKMMKGIAKMMNDTIPTHRGNTISHVLNQAQSRQMQSPHAGVIHFAPTNFFYALFHFSENFSENLIDTSS